MVIQQFLHLVVKPKAFDASPAVCKKDFISDGAHHFGQSVDNTFPENQTGRGMIFEIFHICRF